MTQQRCGDFFRLHCDRNDSGWCFCVAWWVETWEGWGERTANENRLLRESLFARGEYDGYLLYVDGTPAAWCQVGPRDRLTKLVRQFNLKADPSVWAVTCFFVAPQFRRHGLSDKLLEAVIKDVRSQGVKIIEAFPKHGRDLDASDLWTGPEELFVRHGFKLQVDDHARPVYALKL